MRLTLRDFNISNLLQGPHVRPLKGGLAAGEPIDLLNVVAPTPEWRWDTPQTGGFCHNCNFNVVWAAKVCSIGEYPFAMLIAYMTNTASDASRYWNDFLRRNVPPMMTVVDEGFLGDESIKYLLDTDEPENNCIMTWRMRNVCIWMFTGQKEASSDLAWFFANQIVGNISPPPEPPEPEPPEPEPPEPEPPEPEPPEPEPPAQFAGAAVLLILAMFMLAD